VSMTADGTAGMWLESGEPVVLGPPLGGATGEGTVYEVAGRPQWVAKVFHRSLTDLQSKLDKVAAMVQSPPRGAVQPDGLIVLTWPESVLAGESGPLGYVMPRIGTASSVELHTMSNPSNRMDPMPTDPQWTRNATWGHLVNVAANLCLAVEVVHRVDAVIGDFQERNILVSDTTRVTLVDCDSMQFTDRTGRRFLCGVGRPEFTAPELAGVNLRTHAREKESDLFALAVHIHQLLMAGNHPFLRGEWTLPGDQPDALTLAKSGDWAGGPNSRLRTHPMAPPLSFLPTDIQQYFTRAFTAGARDPSARPTAAQWRVALSRIGLTTCSRDVHQVPVGCAFCPWCVIDVERASRKQRQDWLRPGDSTGSQSALSSSSTGPMLAGGRTTTPKKEPDRVFGMSTRVYLTVLLSVVLIVVALAAFIIWALLSGATTFGAGGSAPPEAILTDVLVRE